ncbi:Uncharacterized lipoprotein NlpE involved in copper resistance [Saccharicrinis carchari]|uniref:Uncharacterized lipoprotein NlpE involved in copper resistance n=1 Tax=Saccharicrinis carchari TaxID=1168039 RepID=A0A521DFT5_SACCC|nr:copper resistance protein NlpE N-terminal domain-containing protein [Saccharicrinis carchari]SMO70478.1 Uncharacterized lipoprotein NlpE involved in copper resistance [Saccharicrinis carchari]
MKKLLFVVATVTAVLLTSCNRTKKTDKKTTVDTHSAQNALDWEGTYYGVTPCASCPGIETELTLTADLNYVLTRLYLEEDESEYTLEGKFSWKGNNIELEEADKDSSPVIFKVEENQVRQLDRQGKAIEGELASHYVLTKNGNLNVENKRWELKELNGKAVEGSAETHYIIFHSKENRIEAKANCNNLLFDYTIRHQFQLITSPGAATLISCPEDDGMEREFIDAISTADNLSVTETTLSLNKARMAPLAKFELVKN